MNIRRGISQGCVSSPLMYKVIFKAALYETEAGIIIIINNLRYAEEMVLLATSLEDLQFLLDSVVDEVTKCKN